MGAQVNRGGWNGRGMYHTINKTYRHIVGFSIQLSKEFLQVLPFKLISNSSRPNGAAIGTTIIIQ